MKRKISFFIKLKIFAGKANPAPPVGQALGQYSLNLMEFCKLFNERTKNFNENILLPVKIAVFNDKSFLVFIKLPTITFFAKIILGVTSASWMPKREIIGYLTLKHLYELSLIKLIQELNRENMCKIIKANLNSMGIEIKKNF